MTRMPMLAALALACAFSSPAFASASINYGPEGASGAHALATGLASLGAMALNLLIIVALGAFLIRATPRLGRVSRAALMLYAALVLVPATAFAAEVVAAVPTAPAVILPWGDWVVAIGQTLTAILMPILVGLAGKAVYQVAPWARMILTQARLEQMTKAVTDYALNATEGVVKGQALTIPVGSAVIAKAVQRAVDAAPAKVVAAAGGPNGVAELVFRTLHLETGATAANTLAPAQAAIVAN